jgi:hypothetical protein
LFLLHQGHNTAASSLGMEQLKGKNFLFIVKKLHGMTSISDDVFEVVRITDDPVVIDAYHADGRDYTPQKVFGFCCFV